MFFLLREIIRGKSFARALFNHELCGHEVSGRVLDIGGGKHQDYLGMMNIHEGASVETVDMAFKEGQGNVVDFETDELPFSDLTFDYVLVFNVLEHIYHYNFLVEQMRRVLKAKGSLVGFVPFLVNYHPDPHDYFRYTKEALQKILNENGFKSVHVVAVGRGPFAVNYNNIMLSIPRVVRIVIFPLFFFADAALMILRPNIVERYPLGYLFIAKK